MRAFFGLLLLVAFVAGGWWVMQNEGTPLASLVGGEATVEETATEEAAPMEEAVPMEEAAPMEEPAADAMDEATEAAGDAAEAMEEAVEDAADAMEEAVGEEGDAAAPEAGDAADGEQDGAALRMEGGLIIATEGGYPPFNYVDANGELTGFDVDFANALCVTMELECSIVARDWDALIDGLIAGDYNAVIASLTISRSHGDGVIFSDKYYHTPARFVVRKDWQGPVDKAALAGRTIGVEEGTVHAQYAADAFVDSEIVSYEIIDDATLALSDGDVDAVFSDAVLLNHWLSGSEDGTCCAFAGGTYREAAYFGEGVGVAFRTEDVALRDAVNEAIEEMVDNGSYAEINERYFPFNIY